MVRGCPNHGDLFVLRLCGLKTWRFRFPCTARIRGLQCLLFLRYVRPVFNFLGDEMRLGTSALRLSISPSNLVKPSKYQQSQQSAPPYGPTCHSIRPQPFLSYSSPHLSTDETRRQRKSSQLSSAFPTVGVRPPATDSQTLLAEMGTNPLRHAPDGRHELAARRTNVGDARPTQKDSEARPSPGGATHVRTARFLVQCSTTTTNHATRRRRLTRCEPSFHLWRGHHFNRLSMLGRPRRTRWQRKPSSRTRTLDLPPSQQVNRRTFKQVNQPTARTMPTTFWNIEIAGPLLPHPRPTANASQVAFAQTLESWFPEGRSTTATPPRHLNDSFS